MVDEIFGRVLAKASYADKRFVERHFEGKADGNGQQYEQAVRRTEEDCGHYPGKKISHSRPIDMFTYARVTSVVKTN
ncbi:MAG: hypothetical protein EXR27_20175 [Betaproteobacteria bacterium]|nr:hypothetical protein [Betaproteobacteria bacterium]